MRLPSPGSQQKRVSHVVMKQNSVILEITNSRILKIHASDKYNSLIKLQCVLNSINQNAKRRKEISSRRF